MKAGTATPHPAAPLSGRPLDLPICPHPDEGTLVYVGLGPPGLDHRLAEVAAVGCDLHVAKQAPIAIDAGLASVGDQSQRLTGLDAIRHCGRRLFGSALGSPEFL